jgi:hypothetical protein
MIIKTWYDREVEMSEITEAMNKTIETYSEHSLTVNDFRIDIVQDAYDDWCIETELVCGKLRNVARK